jgi:hypothetical protein
MQQTGRPHVASTQLDLNTIERPRRRAIHNAAVTHVKPALVARTFEPVIIF